MNKIDLIYTGGTIGGDTREIGPISKDLSRSTFEYNIKKILPSSITNNINSIVSTSVNKLSENMQPSDWTTIAKKVDELYLNGSKGIVIAHGTDTMSYSSAAISYMLRGIKIPIVLTGSNLPLTDKNTDAIQNISDAICAAAEGTLKGVFIVFSGTKKSESIIHIGTKVRKLYRKSDNIFIFKSINHKHLGEIKSNIITTDRKVVINNKNLYNDISTKINETDYIFSDAIKEKIQFFKLFPGFDPKHIECCIDNKVQGMILELYGSGTACIEGNCSILNPLKKAKNNNIPIFAVSQNNGKIGNDIYKSEEKLNEFGVVGLGDMTPEAAIPKLMWALGNNEDTNAIKKVMQTNIFFEI